MSWIFLGLFVLKNIGVYAAKPNFFFILVDDLGWGDVGFHRNQQDNEIQTPNMDNLVINEGLELLRHYVHYTCTPTRSSFQSGRIPYHVQITLDNPDQPNAGIPRNMTCIGNKMKLGGYQTHIVGKWDCGMATFNHTPKGRGYDTSLIYFEHKNDYWTQIQAQSGCMKTVPNIVDLWMNNNTYEGPAFGLNGTDYEEYIFANTIYDLIENDFVNNDSPFFMVYTPHIVHCPLQVPQNQYQKFNFSNDENECQQQTAYVWPGFNNGNQFKCRQIYHSMVYTLDEIIGNIVTKLKNNNLWDNTLLVLSTDNGGPETLPESGANNTPLRGGKYSPWEGGIRGTAFVSGGLLPKERRGKQETGIIHISDWLATFSDMIGVNPSDPNSDIYGFPNIDGFNVWPLVSGTNLTSPRNELYVDNNTLIQGNYKYLKGQVSWASWSGNIFPNSSSPQHPVEGTSQDCSKGCLYDVLNDYTEHNNIANNNENIVNNMEQRLNELKKTFFTNKEKGINSCPPNITIECACWMAQNYWEMYFGPYQYMNISNNNHVKVVQ